MIRDHIPQGTRRVVIAAALLDAQAFGDGDLDVINVIAIPDRLKDAVAKTKYQNILNRLFAQIMIDAIDLSLLYGTQKIGVQSFGGIQIAAEWLFINKPPPIAVLFFAKAVLDYLVRDVCKQCGRRGEIVKIILRYLMRRGDLADQILQIAKQLFVVVKIAAGVIDPFLKPFDQLDRKSVV